MRVRYQPAAIPILTESPFVIRAPYAIDRLDVVEIGCGKGQFIVNLANAYPERILIGIEQSSDVLFRAVQKLDALPLDNLKFIWGNADEVLEALPDFDMLYLQFSDPWPKARHEKRRLTTLDRLNRYYDKVRSTVLFKTDNEAFYLYSLSQFEASFFTVTDHGQLSQFSMTTEFEDKYRKLKKPIYYIEARK